MPASVISTTTAEHYGWGGVDGTACDGWYLLRTSELNIIEERMPPGTAETRHSHRRARQFFFVLAGELALEVEHHNFVLHPGEGLEIAPGQAHRAANRSNTDLRILVTSQPPSHGDRIDPLE